MVKPDADRVADLGVAGVANGLLHPLLALNVGFPGLATSLLMAAVGVLLLAQLARVTR